MDRNREARKSTMAASGNGLPRRRQRSNSLRDSPEEDGPMDLQETARLRDRGVKKDRDRDRSSRNKRRRGDRLNGGEESSEESVNDDEEEDYDDERGGGAGGGAVRMFPPPNPTVSISSSLSNHQYVNRKSFPPSATAKILRPSPPGWKPADPVIGFTVPRKARSASGKRSQECSISGSGVGAEQINGQTSISPVRLTSSPAPGSPPSSSNASVRKKMKPNGSKPRPPKSTSKPSSSNPEELEIEIAEVLYGMMTQSHSSSKKEITGSDSANLDLREINIKSGVSSPISNSTSQLPQNSSSSAAPLSAVAPKRKRPRQVSDNLGSFNVQHSISSTTATKVEVDLPQKKEISSPNIGSAAENGSVQLDFASSQVGPPLSEPPPPDSDRSECRGENRDVVLAKEEAVSSPKKESPVVRPDNDREVATATKTDSTISSIESHGEEKFQIDLMALPPQTRSSPEREGDINFRAALEPKMLNKDKEDETTVKNGREEAMKVEPEQKKVKMTVEEAVEPEKNPVVIKERSIDLQLDLEKQERDVSVSGNKLNPEVQKPQQQQKAFKDEPPHIEKIAQSGSLPPPMSVASWPGGLPPMGYMAPLQGVVSMDGNTPIQPLFSHPRPKRCGTHCYIARNIHYLQQFVKMNPFWPPPAGSAASLFGAKPCNLNVMPSAELQANNVGRTVNAGQEKGQGLTIFSGHSGKEKVAQATNIPDAQRKQQQILLQPALPPGAASNILHGPAFIFPFNQQQAAAAAAASIRPGSVKPPPTASGNVASTTASTAVSVGGSTTAPPAGTAVTFNYPNIPASETPYLAILQNNPYPFPIPSVGAPPTYRGTHAQAMPFFNGSFYPSQIMHPSQLQQQQQQPSTQQQNTSSSSSSSQKHLHSQQQQQQRPQGSSGNNLHSFPAQKKANQHMPNAEMGGEDSPTAESRISRASMGVYSQNFAAVPMPIHPQNFTLMTSPPPSSLSGAASGGGNQGEKKQQQHQPQHQQQGLKAGVESVTPQTFAMSFGSMNAVDMSSVVQNHAMLQNLPETVRHSYLAAAAAAHAAQQKKNFRVSEEGKTVAGGNDSPSIAGEEKKSLTGKPPSIAGQQSIVFSRTDLPDSISGTPLRVSRSSSTPNVMATANTTANSPLQAQMQYHQHQQQMMQLHKHHQQQQQQLAAAAAVARNKTPPTSNGSVYSDHMASAAKFPNGISNFQQNLVQNSSSSPSQSPQWKNSLKTTSQVPSTTSSLKNLPQQQNRSQHNQTQISFGGTQKPATAPLQVQQAATSHQAPSPPMAVGSPTTSSISKGAGGSPRPTTTAASAGSKSAQPSSLSSQPSKNTVSVGSRNITSALSNSHVTSLSNTSAKHQMQQHQQQQQQQQMFMSHTYAQAQASNQPFYLQRRRHLEQPPHGSSATTSTGMMSVCSPVTGSNASTSDAKAVAPSAASAAASNLKSGGLSSQGILHSAVPPGFSYVHAVPSSGQVKPSEQKQPAGNDNLHTCWQPEKK